MLIYKDGVTMATARKRGEAALLFQALSDETRLRLLERLREGEQCVCELTDAFKTGQSRLSFHLRVLKNAGLVTDRPEGRWIYYSLNPDALRELEDLVAWLKESTPRDIRVRRC
jgi:ArsR family transcriptional regulator, arsenate/arsenite/antimonite-responsive transcriptional repressor